VGKRGCRITLIVRLITFSVKTIRKRLVAVKSVANITRLLKVKTKKIPKLTESLVKAHWFDRHTRMVMASQSLGCRILSLLQPAQTNWTERLAAYHDHFDQKT
jgi:hypothetical protein